MDHGYKPLGFIACLHFWFTFYFLVANAAHDQMGSCSFCRAFPTRTEGHQVLSSFLRNWFVGGREKHCPCMVSSALSCRIFYIPLTNLFQRPKDGRGRTLRTYSSVTLPVCSLLPRCGCSVTAIPFLLLPCLACHNGMHPLEQSRVHSSFLKLLLVWYFVREMKKSNWYTN